MKKVEVDPAIFKPDLIEKYVEYLRLEKDGGLSQGSIDRYLLNLRHLCNISKVPLLDIKTYQVLSGHICGLRQKHDWSSSTTKNAADSYSVFYTWALRFGYITHAEHPMPMGHEFTNKDRPQMDFFEWSDHDFRRLIYNPSNSLRDHVIMHTLRSSGIRAGELCGLNFRNPCDVFLEDRFFRIREGKGRKAGDVNFDVETQEWLREYLKQMKLHSRLDALFQNDDFTARLTTPALYKMVSRKAAKLGIHGYPHKFRRSLGGEMIANGADLTMVKDQLRHARISTTADHYVGFKSKRRRENYDKFTPTMESREEELSA